MSDNGPAFKSIEFQDFLQQNGIEHVHSLGIWTEWGMLTDSADWLTLILQGWWSWRIHWRCAAWSQFTRLLYRVVWLDWCKHTCMKIAGTQSHPEAFSPYKWCHWWVCKHNTRLCSHWIKFCSDPEWFNYWHFSTRHFTLSLMILALFQLKVIHCTFLSWKTLITWKSGTLKQWGLVNSHINMRMY